MILWIVVFCNLFDNGSLFGGKFSLVKNRWALRTGSWEQNNERTCAKMECSERLKIYSAFRSHSAICNPKSAIY